MKECKHKKQRDLPGFQEEPGSRLGFPRALTIHLVYSHCLPTLISLIQEQTVAMLQGHQDGRSLAVRDDFLRKQNGLHPHVLRSL